MKNLLKVTLLAVISLFAMSGYADPSYTVYVTHFALHNALVNYSCTCSTNCGGLHDIFPQKDIVESHSDIDFSTYGTYKTLSEHLDAGPAYNHICDISDTWASTNANAGTHVVSCNDGYSSTNITSLDVGAYLAHGAITATIQTAVGCVVNNRQLGVFSNGEFDFWGGTDGYTYVYSYTLTAYPMNFDAGGNVVLSGAPVVETHGVVYTSTDPNQHVYIPIPIPTCGSPYFEYGVSNVHIVGISIPPPPEA